MSNVISIRCRTCKVKLKAPYRLVGQFCPCPQCKQPVFIQLPTPSDANILIIPPGADEPQATASVSMRKLASILKD